MALRQLPITGRRYGMNGVVIAHATVLDDEFTRTFLVQRRWNIDNHGYANTRLSKAEGRRLAKLHRLVYEHYHGRIPPGLEVDHIDRNKLNCTPSNLRAVSRPTNGANRPKQGNNTSGYKGVCYVNGRAGYVRPRPWRAEICVRGQRQCLGYFATAEDAYRAYYQASKRHHPEVQLPAP